MTSGRMRREAGTAARVAMAAATVIGLGVGSAAEATAQAFLEPDTVVLNTFTAEATGDGYGWAAERIGDIDGDGAAEYVITAILNRDGGIRAGKAYVYSGRTGALLHTVVGAPNERMGFGVSAGGDVNADGVPDYVLGAPGIGRNPARVIVLSGADHSVLLQIPGDPLTFLGFDVAIVKDVNGDGHDDVVAGAPLASPNGLTQAGRVNVYSGATGSLLWSAAGTQFGGNMGTAVTGLPDLNGDGIPEVGAGASGEIHDPGKTKIGGGQAYILSGADGSVIRPLTPMGTAAAFGFFFIHDAGDVNADGVHDVFVGDVGDTIGGNCSRGRGYVFSGTNGEKLRNIPGEHCGDGMGIGRGAGDVDGDGYDDILLGAYLSSEGNFQAGKCYLVSGKNGKYIRTFTATMNNAQVGFDTVAIGDVNGDGLPDWLLTGLDVAYVVAGRPLQPPAGSPTVDSSLPDDGAKSHVTQRDRVLPDGTNLTDPSLRYWR